MMQKRPLLPDWLIRYWFFLGIALVVPAAVVVPSAGAWLRRWHLLQTGIFTVFFITGLTLELRQIRDARQNFKAVTASLLSSLILFPALTFLLCRLFLSDLPDFIVGSLILSVSPVTIASGAVMTGIAGGNIPLSLFICIAGNIAAVFTVPFSLDLMLHGKSVVSLPAVQMITNLFFIIIVPIAIGQLFRFWLKASLEPWHKAFSIFSQFVVLMIIFNAVTGSATRLGSAGSQISLLFIFVIALHGMILALNLGLSRLFGLDPPSTAAFTIQTSQKTLTVSYLVWAGYFSSAFPMAIYPAVGYHLTQMVADTLMAHRMRDWIRKSVQSQNSG
ncbi:MAG: bile acid:sodium symporter [Deltaproteobacteria bacterium]|nr:bile acid:sodium symporter [Deltaproteobacteria bacterium]